MSVSPIIISVLGLLVLIAIVVGFMVSRYKVAKPDEAIIVSGSKGKTGTPQKVVQGGTFVWPVIQQASNLNLSARRIEVKVNSAVSKQGIRLNVSGVAVVRVNGESEGAILAAASRYLGQQNKISEDTTEVLSGALRSIIGQLNVVEILNDRSGFAKEVAEVTGSSLTGSGLALDSFQIQDIIDEGYGSEPGSYLRDLERPEAARAAQEASIAEAEARRISERKSIEADQAVLEAKRELELRTAQIKSEVDAAKAIADAAGPLAIAEREQIVLSEKQKVAIQQAELTDRQLDTEVRKPADAQRYKTEVEAEAERVSRVKKADADKASTIAAAEAKAKQDELTGVGEQKRRTALAEAQAYEVTKEGEAERAKRAALAEAVRLEGLAEAEATLAVGQAEAEAMEKKADAFNKYNQAAVLEMVVGVLPTVAKELAAPLAAIDNLTVLSTEGASAVSKSVTDNFTQLQHMLKSTVGVDLTEIIDGFVNKSEETSTTGRSAKPKVAIQSQKAEVVNPTENTNLEG